MPGKNKKKGDKGGTGGTSGTGGSGVNKDGGVNKGGAGGEEENGKEQEPGVFKGLAMLSSMGIAMVVSTFIGLLIGIYLDKLFSTKPWLTIIFLFFGIAAGFKNIYETIKKYASSDG